MVSLMGNVAGSFAIWPLKFLASISGIFDLSSKFLGWEQICYMPSASHCKVLCMLCFLLVADDFVIDGTRVYEKSGLEIVLGNFVPSLNQQLLWLKTFFRLKFWYL